MLDTALSLLVLTAIVMCFLQSYWSAVRCSPGGAASANRRR